MKYNISVYKPLYNRRYLSMNMHFCTNHKTGNYSDTDILIISPSLFIACCSSLPLSLSLSLSLCRWRQHDQDSMKAQPREERHGLTRS